MKNVKTLVIKRSRWLRGESNSYLLRPKDKKMCCLGFYARACGAQASDINGYCAPSEYSGFPAWLLSDDFFAGPACSSAAYKLMRANDSVNKTDKQREKIIKAEFKKRGVTVKFVP